MPQMSGTLGLLRLLATFLVAWGLASGSRDSLIFITLEEHWLSPALTNTTLSNVAAQLLINGSFPSSFPAHLRDVGPLRLANMTANRIRKQVVSHTTDPAALDRPDLITQANNELAAAIANNTDRFNAFAALPMAFPQAAADELERCVSRLGFVGALVDTRLPNGTYYDGAAYRPFWAKAQELDVPIYLHPTLPNVGNVTSVGVGIYAPASPVDFSLFTAADLGIVAWGWHQDAGLHFLRLYAAGIFDEFPRLTIVLGHMGEMLPFMLERADAFLSMQNTSRPTLIETWAHNVWITTAGFFSLNPMATILRNTAVDRIMYSVDYPFGNSVNGSMFMAELRSSGLVNENEWEMIAYKNAQRLLRIS